MKKTIIITIAMLCVFGAVVMFGADRVQADWQKPSEDDVEISANSPVELVQNEFRMYNFVLPSDKPETYQTLWKYGVKYYIEPTKDMLTYVQAASCGGTIIEQHFDWIDIGETPLFIELEDIPGKGAFYRVHYRSEGGISVPNYECAVCKFDAYTGELYAVTAEGGTEGTLVEILKMERQYGQISIENAELKEKVLAAVREFAAEKGYADVNRYVTRSVGEDYHEIYLTANTDNVIRIVILFDEYGNHRNMHFSVDKNNADVVEYINTIGESFVQEG